MTDVRKPPYQAQLDLHLPKKRGKCVWCGKPVGDEKTRWGGARLNWHNACREEFDVIAFPDRARDAVFKRDQGRCADCGEDWSERFIFRKGTNCGHFCEGDQDGYRAGFYRSTEVLWISLWHVDHKVPLWKVRHLPALERLEYFKLANLITRCHRCHALKTSEEAAERAHFKRLAAPAPAKPKSKWVSRPMGKRPAGSGNGFPPKGSTPMRRKK